VNNRQRNIFIAAAIAIAAMGIYPPFTFQGMNGATINLGYGWIFAPPRLSEFALGAVNFGLLLTQWIGVLIVGAIALVLTNRQRQVANQQIANYVGVRGWLLLFCVSITILSPLLATGNLYLSFLSVRELALVIPEASSAYLKEILLSSAVSLFGIVTGSLLWMGRREGLSLVGYYLFAAVAAPIFSIGLYDHEWLPQEVRAELKQDAIWQIIATLGAAVVWFFYFMKSKRVRATYGGNLTGNLDAK
jgi:uncharacterized protein DUF2569